MTTNTIELISLSEKDLANKHWHNDNHKMDYQGEKLTLKEIYDREIEYAKKHFESVKEIADKIPKDKFILFVNSAREGTTHYKGIETIDKDRLEKMNEAETGYKDTHPDDFQALNMRYCLGFEKDSKKFKEFKSYEDTPEDLDLTNCVGIVYSGSEINVLNEEIEERKNATIKIREIMEKSKKLEIPQLGICFGGQLLSNEAGAKIQLVKNIQGVPTRIIGIKEMIFTEKAKDDPIVNILEKTFVAQNHGQEINKESVEKVGGVVLAVSEAGAPEIVRFSDKIYVLQFHPEVGSVRVDVATSIGENPSDPKETFKNPISKTKEVIMTGFMNIVINNLEKTQES